MVNRLHVIKKLRSVNTRNGTRFVIDMFNNNYFYVPDETSEWLCMNANSCKELEKLIETKGVCFKRLELGGIAFMNKSASILGDDSDSDTEAIPSSQRV